MQLTQRQFDQLWPRCYAVALSVLRHAEEAEDAAQNALIAFTIRGHQREEGGSMRYLYRIVQRCAFDQRQRRQEAVSLDSSREETDWLADACCIEESVVQKEAILSCLFSLRSDWIAVLYLVDIEGRTYRETAGTLGLTEEIVRQRIKRARQAFLKKWKETEHVTAD